MNKEFSGCDVLTISTGKLLTNFDNLYSILAHLAGEPVYTHEIPDAIHTFKPYILECFPELAEINTVEKFSDLEYMMKDYSNPEDAVNDWVKAQVGDRKFSISPYAALSYSI
jgi:hypothetical protein